MSSHVETRLKEIICERLEVASEQITSDASLTSDLGADSLDLVDLAMSVEEAFSLRIHERDYERLIRIGDAIEYITSRLNAEQVAH